jgi:SAM-dependent methyltransferase
MTVPESQHQVEILNNLDAWRGKRLLREVYAGFYGRIVPWIDRRQSGVVVEIGSGIGNLRGFVPEAICTDLFLNPWLDLVCDGYALPIQPGVVSHLVLLDVFHHLEMPHAFLDEAGRVLSPGGRVIILDPYMSWLSHPVYGLLHHEPVAWNRPIDLSHRPPSTRRYHAAQGNATRLFFGARGVDWAEGWTLCHAEAFSALEYLLSGGFSRRAMYPIAFRPAMVQLDRLLSRWPRVFGARCLVVLERNSTLHRQRRT